MNIVNSISEKQKETLKSMFKKEYYDSFRYSVMFDVMEEYIASKLNPYAYLNKKFNKLREEEDENFPKNRKVSEEYSTRTHTPIISRELHIEILKESMEEVEETIRDIFS